MSTPAQHRQALANMQALYGTPPRIHSEPSEAELLAQVRTGAQGLAERVQAWGEGTTPGVSTLADAERAAAGLQRVLGQLRQQVEGRGG